MTSKLFAKVRKQSSYTKSGINLNLFSVMLVSIQPTIQYHHNYKITDSGKLRIVLKARKFSFKATRTILRPLRFTRAKFTCFLYCSEINTQKRWTSMDRMRNVVQEKSPTYLPPDRQDYNPSYICFTNNSITIRTSSFPISLQPPKKDEWGFMYI